MDTLFGYFIIGLVILLIVFLLYLPIYFILKKKRIPLIRQITYIGLAGTSFIIVFATILIGGVNFHPTIHLLNLKPFEWIRDPYEMGMQRMNIQLIANILMFCPLGVLLPIVFNKLRSAKRIVLCILVSTIIIETFQYFIGRSADIDDVIMNTIGGVIGYAIFWGLNKLCTNQKWWKQINQRNENN